MRWIAPLLLAFLITACAGVQVYPKDDGSFVVVTQSESDKEANDTALREANAYCHKQGLQFSIVKLRTSYEGASQESKAPAPQLRAREFGQPEPKAAGPNDHTIELTFRCK